MCARLLRLLKTHDGKKFVTTQEHSKISPCTLPEWLPANIIKKMTVEFGIILRKELVKPQQHTELMRHRTPSNETRRISLDSMGGSEAEFVDQDRYDRAFRVSDLDSLK